ncbi:MAG: glycosyltransferase [Bacteroidaceae bacterium]
MERVAVIMSIYKNDTVSVVRECVESLLHQLCEGIIIDLWIQFDGKVDADVDLYLHKMQQTHSLFIFQRSENKGLAFSLNELIERVREKDYTYIARMDADDISMPDRIAKQVAFLQHHKEVDCVGTWAVEFDTNGDYFHKQMPVTHDECFRFFARRDCMIHPTVMFRNTYFDKAGLYPEDTYFGEDTMMWANGFYHGCVFANIPEYLLRFRLDGQFFQRRRGWKHAKSIFQLRHRVNKMLGFGWKSEAYACLYSLAKLMPTAILNVIYKNMR